MDTSYSDVEIYDIRLTGGKSKHYFFNGRSVAARDQWSTVAVAFYTPCTGKRMVKKRENASAVVVYYLPTRVRGIMHSRGRLNHRAGRARGLYGL